MKIKIENLPKEKIIEKRITAWPIWSCEVSEFDWEYDAEESCLLLEGDVEMTVGVKVTFTVLSLLSPLSSQSLLTV